MPGDGRHVGVACSKSFRLLSVDGVEVIDLGGDLCAVAAGGERCNAPIGDGDDDYVLRVVASEGYGSLQECGEFLSILLRIEPAVLIVDADQQRNEPVGTMGLRGTDP